MKAGSSMPVLTAPNWAALCACSKGDFALWEWNVGLQSPCAADICSFCPEELCTFPLGRKGLLWSSRTPWLGIPSTTQHWSGMCPQLSH